MEFINANDLAQAGAMAQGDGILVMQNGRFCKMSLQEFQNYIASASIEVDPTLSVEGVAADAKATGDAIAAGGGSTGIGRNILDNWYFGNPVNQRGETAYNASSQMYGLDRWKMYKVDLTVNDGYANLKAPYGTHANFRQHIEFPEELVGKTVTFSALMDIKNNPEGVSLSWATLEGVNTACENFNAGTTTPGVKLYQATFVVPEGFSGVSIYLYCTNAANVPNVDLYAVKLELGEKQTLATQKSGAWVLNEIPSYVEQFDKACRYFFNPFFGTSNSYFHIGDAVAGSTTSASMSITIPEMRISPALILFGNFLMHNIGEINNATIASSTRTAISITLTPSITIVTGNTYACFLKEGKMHLSAEL